MQLEGQSEEDERLRCYACGEVHAGARLVTTIDGRVFGNYQEAWFRYNEAVWVLKTYRSKRTRTGYLDAVEAKRGQAARAALRAEMLRVWEWKQSKGK